MSFDLTAPWTSAKIKAWLQGYDDAVLFQTADTVRRSVFGDEVYIRGIIEFTNYCRNDCLYCGLRRSNRQVERYRLTVDEILTTVAETVNYGIKTIVLQGGEDPYYRPEQIAAIIQTIRQNYPVAVTLSLGEHPEAIYRLWREAGADRYLLRMETWSKPLYEQLRPGHRWEQRLDCLKSLRALGYEVGSGFMVGLPGETLDDLATAILELTALDLDMIGIGPYLVHPDTPLNHANNGSVELSLRTLALVRILNPYANMPATSAMECAQPGARTRALQIGMNVLMPSLTPEKVKEYYRIYPGKNAQTDSVEHSLAAARAMVEQAGLRWSDSLGMSPNWWKRNQINQTRQLKESV